MTPVRPSSHQAGPSDQRICARGPSGAEDTTVRAATHAQHSADTEASWRPAVTSSVESAFEPRTPSRRAAVMPARSAHTRA